MVMLRVCSAVALPACSTPRAPSPCPGGLYLNSAGGPAGGFAPAEAYANGGYAMRPSGSVNSSGGGSVNCDPRTGSMSGGGNDLSYTVSGGDDAGPAHEAMTDGERSPIREGAGD